MNNVILKALNKLLLGKKHKHCNNFFVFSDLFTVDKFGGIWVSVDVTSENNFFWGELLYWKVDEIVNDSLKLLTYNEEVKLGRDLTISTMTFNGLMISNNDGKLPEFETNNALRHLHDRYGELRNMTPNNNIIHLVCEYEVVSNYFDDNGLYVDIVSQIKNIYINDKEVFELPDEILGGLCYSLTYSNNIQEWVSDTFYNNYDHLFCLVSTDSYVNVSIDYNTVWGEIIDNDSDSTTKGWKEDLDELIIKSDF